MAQPPNQQYHNPLHRLLLYPCQHRILYRSLSRLLPQILLSDSSLQKSLQGGWQDLEDCRFCQQKFCNQNAVMIQHHP